jgi:hypothetical protein
LQASSQRRGVMPLVLFWNLPGVERVEVGNSSFLSSSVCSAATPLTACEPTTARFAMRIDFGAVLLDQRTHALLPCRPASGLDHLHQAALIS